MVHKLNVEDKIVGVGRLRSIASQVIACMSPNLLLLDLGMAISFSTIALPDLLNSSGELSLDDTQASWFGSLLFLTQPLGALMSGPMVDYFGRKKANFLANIPHLIAWVLMYFAWNIPSLYVACIMLGLGTGVMEAPVNSYVGEISEASIRGALCTVAQLFTSMGTFLMFFLGTVVHWRTAALICLSAPIASMLLVLLVPETPVWLLVRGREKEALKSLCYLRGWTSPQDVREEFDQLDAYTKTLERCVVCWNEEPDPVSCPHRDMNPFKRWVLKVRYVMLGKETLRPLSLVILYFAFYVICGLAPIRPNMVNFCRAFGMADDGKNIVLMVGIITLVTSVLIVGGIKVIGKRKLGIGSMLGCACSYLALSIYARIHIKDSVFTYDVTTFPEETSYVPLVFFYILTISTGFSIPWVLLGEVFPFRSRASAQGIAAAANYVIIFVSSKTLIDLESATHLWGTCAVYATFGFIGTIYLYFFLPETEGKTLAQIESYYNGDLKIFADDPFINYFKRLSSNNKKL